MGICTSRYDKPAQIDHAYFPALKDSLPSASGKVVAVTGCTTGTGLVLAEVAAEKGATVLLLNRPSPRADAALKMVQAKGKAVHVDCDLTSFAAVKKAIATMTRMRECYGGLDVLCCNAGIMASKQEATVDGADIQMQVNHLSHFLLCQGLMPLLLKAAAAKGEARIVNHSSIARSGPKLRVENLGKNGNNLGGDDAGMLPFVGPRWERYQQTKLANYVFTMALHDKLKAKGSKVKVLVAHPGVAATELQVKSVADGGMSGNLANAVVCQSSEDGACGIIKCSLAADVESGQFYGPTGGGMYGPAELLPEDPLADSESKTMLWQESEKTTGVTYAV